VTAFDRRSGLAPGGDRLNLISEPTMLNRRKFLAGLLAGPAAVLGHETPQSRVNERTIWVIIGVNWSYNDEFCYQEGDYLTEYAFPDKEAAYAKSAELIEAFCAEEEIETFIQNDLTLPEDWEEMSLRQQWNWVFGQPDCSTEEDDYCCDSVHGSVPIPYEVREMTLPASAVRQIETMRSRP
jgi:hypothetical protein